MGKKIRKAIGALLMAVAIAVTQIPVSDAEAVDNAAASDFQMDGTTLVKYIGTSENVSIGGYVEKIEMEAFAGNASLKTVTFGNGVKCIGAGAFEGCSALQSVTIPDSVESIEQAAFADCPSLTTVRVGTGLSFLGNGVFAGDISLDKVSISSSNPNFICDDGAIYSKDGKDTLYVLLSGRKAQSYSMPTSVSNIRPYAFWGDRYLESVSVSGNVGEISAYAFSNCRNLKSVNIPYSVSSISIKAFENCIRLRNITIPVSVRSIHSTAFDGCTKLKIHAQEGSTAKAFADNLVLEDIDITEYEDTPIDTVIDEEETNDTEEEEPLVVDYYHEVTHMNPLENEDEDASVKGMSKIIGSQVFVFMDNAAATVNSGTPEMNQIGGVAYGDTGETIASISQNADVKGGSFPKYTIVDDTLIANQAYYNDSRTVIEIPDTITEIGEFAFARSGLTNAVIPEGVTRIGYAAFYHCDNLTDIVIPSTVTEIGLSAFDNTPWLRNWEQGALGDFLIVGDGILLDYCGSNSIVNIPNTVRTIGAGALKNHTEIEQVILPDSVVVIGEGAFEGCSKLTDLEGGNNIKQIKDRAFAGCPLQEIRIPASVETIGLRAFDVADSVKMTKNGVVIFEGNALPKLSYEASSGKLYHEDYRGLAFDGVTTAIVSENVEPIDGTILDENVFGFRGVVQKGKTGSQLLNTSYESDTQQVDGADESTDMQGLEPTVSTGGIIVNINSNTIDTNGLAFALLDGSEGSYILNIEDSNDAKSSIQDSYRKLYGNNIPINLQAYEITLQEADTLIPITGLGRQNMEITMPVPEGIREENLHVVCLDANGQLEEVQSRVTSVDGIDCIVFSSNHFSPYGIYNYSSGNTAAINNGQAVFTSLSGNKDASPDTGDHDIHPKWFLGCGLLFTGLALFFYSGKKRKTV